MRSGGHFAAVPYVNAAWPYREAGVAGGFAPPAVGSLLEVPSGLMDVCLGQTRVPGASLSPAGGSLLEVPSGLMGVRLSEP